MRRVPVMLPYPFPGPFDYRVPPELDPQPGDVVLVPLNRREEVGVVWDAAADGGGAGRQAEARVGDPRHPADAAERCGGSSTGSPAYTLSPPGEVMAMALRVVEREPPSPPPVAARRSAARGADHRHGSGCWTC